MPRVPRRLMKDPASADLAAEERHLLDCVDGTMDEDELAFMTGRATDDVAGSE